jgi:hypothetical protein
MLVATVNMSSAGLRRSGSSKLVQQAKHRPQLRQSALLLLAIVLAAFQPLASNSTWWRKTRQRAPAAP